MLVKRIKASHTELKHNDIPFRFVVLEILKGGNIEYSCHWECLPENEKPYYIYGMYDSKLLNAVGDFEYKMNLSGIKEDSSFIPDEKFFKI